MCPPQPKISRPQPGVLSVNSHKNYIFVLVDLLCFLAALQICAWLMLPPELDIFDDYTGASTFTVCSFILSFYMMDCRLVGREDFKDTSVRVFLAVLIGSVCAGFIFYSFDKWRFPRLMFVLQLFVTFGLTLGWRALYYTFWRNFSALPERVLLLGSAGAGRVRRVLSEYMPEAMILGYIGEPGADPNEAGPCLGDVSLTLSELAAKKADRLIIIDTFYLDSDLARNLFAAKLEGLKVHDMRGLYERLAARLPIDLIEDDWLLLADGFSVTEAARRVKRTSDLCLCLPMLLVLSPIILLTALFVRMESKGPAFYTQKRVGLHGKEFTVYKIRSMRNDAEAGGAQWAQAKDPRVTRIGRFIRKTRIDELPQLINVIKGDMSLIGPRPERREFVDELAAKIPYYNVRHAVKPGITGWAQVCHPYGASLDDARYKLEYDLFYIKHLSLLLDAKIFLRTIGVVLFPKGAR